ncbi:carboxypeptidase-like regulatory domain-containing protein [Mucilaginibacter sp. OK098]|uniref:carboxypeptidase-like regulatory domain-containing protein n=1 Tax=Mucilaginibacter sp. OK098 TaxID=1855297 RepID=UPI00091C345C|nr:carboxypeptidase-like regulatory domain-containing protein [Mucilaginibacter sp. OK098]SHM81438.1 CarboxypepD_reg-like domain-containing protein [Mucilaginibacter sp. OK098]
MKFITTIGLLVLTNTIAFSQVISVSGTVNNQKGQPIPFAFVRDVNHNYATYADSAGTFMLKADPASSLQVVALSYKTTEVKTENKTKVDIVMPTGAADGASISTTKTDGANSGIPIISTRQQLLSGSMISAPGGGSTVLTVKSGFNQEETRGSRYLFNGWVPGFGITKKDSVVNEITNVYNYDKINGNLIYTNDGKSTAGVSPLQINSFNLYDKNGKAHTFESAPEINNKPFVEVLLSTPKYKIYKKIDSKLQRADFHTDGVLEMGHRYDEYIDVERYVFINKADSKPQSISLKKSTLKKLLAGDADTFIASQGSRDVDEEYVKDLGSSLSK